MNRLSRVMPALLTRMSIGAPAAASAFFISSSTSATTERLQGAVDARIPNSAFNPSSASARVPESTTRAPCAWSAFAIAPPMPPEAPVTRAVLLERSNIGDRLASYLLQGGEVGDPGLDPGEPGGR